MYNKNIFMYQKHKKKPQAHTKIVNDLIKGLNKHPHIRVWKRCVGGFDFFRKSQFGIKGEPDIDGIVKGGYRLNIEVKTFAYPMFTPEQTKFGHMLLDFDCKYFVYREGESSAELIDKILKK